MTLQTVVNMRTKSQAERYTRHLKDHEVYVINDQTPTAIQLGFYVGESWIIDKVFLNGTEFCIILYKASRSNHPSIVFLQESEFNAIFDGSKIGPKIGNTLRSVPRFTVFIGDK